MLNELSERVDKLGENFNREKWNIKMEMENLKKDQTEMKNTLQGINAGADEAADQIRDLEDKGVENTQSEQQKEKHNPRDEDSRRPLGL